MGQRHAVERGTGGVSRDSLELPPGLQNAPRNDKLLAAELALATIDSVMKSKHAMADTAWSGLWQLCHTKGQEN